MIICLFYVWINPQNVLASPVLNLQEDPSAYSLVHLVEILEDVSGALTIEDMSRKEIAEKFEINQKDSLNFGYTQSVYWARIHLNNRSAKQNKWLLEVKSSNLDQINLYVLDTNHQMMSSREAGDFYPFKQREVQHPRFIFPLNVPPRQEIILYLRVETTGTMTFPLEIINPTAFAERVTREQFINGLYFGLILVMIVYNFALYLSFKGQGYLYYVLFITSLGLALFSIMGLSYQWLWPDVPWLKHRDHAFFFACSTIFMLLFIKKFLDTKKHFPKSDVWLTFLILISLISIFFVSLHRPVWVLQLLAVLMAAIAPFSIYILSFLSWRKGYKPARYLLLAFSALFAGAFLFSLSTFGILPYFFIIQYGVQIGSAFEVCILSLALADRINTLKKDALDAQRILNEELENKVARRTAQLASKNNELVQKNQEMELDLTTAEAVQKQLFIEYSPPSFLKIATHYFPYNHVSGDMYKLYENSEGGFNLFLGDSTGHGVAAALTTIMADLVLTQQKDASPLQVMKYINETLGNHLPNNRFMTGVQTQISREGELTAAVAGHPPIIIIPANQEEPVLLMVKSIPLGVFPDSMYQSKEVRYTLKNGDKGFLYTDGITERTNSEGTMFNVEGLCEFLLKHRSKDVGDIVSLLLEHIESFTQGKEPDDDVTLVAFEYIQP